MNSNGLNCLLMFEYAANPCCETVSIFFGGGGYNSLFIRVLGEYSFIIASQESEVIIWY